MTEEMYRESYGVKDWSTTDLCLLSKMKVDVEKHTWIKFFWIKCKRCIKEALMLQNLEE